jgi:ketosteroid isomerase-like protein
MSAPISSESSTASPYRPTSDHDVAANTRIVQHAIACFQRGDIPALLDTMTDDIEWHIPVVEHAPYTGPRHGRAEAERFFAELAVNQTPRRFEPRQYVAQGDEVVVLGHYAWHVLPTGRDWAGDYAHVFTIRDGRIARFREFMDTGRASAAYRPDA